MKTNNTKINSIAKYICAVLMVLGISVNAWGYDITLYAYIGYTSYSSTVTLNKTEGISAGETITINLDPPTGYYCPNSVIEEDVYTWWGIYFIDDNYNEDYTKVNNGVGNKSFSFKMPAYDIALFVEYKAASAHSVTYNVPSCVTSIGTKSDSQFRSPSASSDLSAYKFEGWTTSSSYSSTTVPSVLYKAGEAIPDNVSAVYAVYTSISSAFSKTSTLTSGNDYMLFITDNASSSAADRYAINNVIDSKNRLEGTSFSVTSSATTGTDWSCIWTFEKGTGDYSSYWFIYNKQKGKYLGVTGNTDSNDSNDRRMQLRDDKNDFTAWTASVTSGQITLTSKKRSSCSNGPSLIGSGSNAGMFNSGSNLFFYGQGATTITYTTNPSCPSTSFTVSYAGNGADGGTLPTDASEYESGDWVVVAENTLTKTGYEFAGWLSSYNGNTYDGDGTAGFYMGDEDVTLTAQWTAATTTITLDKNCTTGSNGTATVKYDATALATKTDATNSATGYHLEGYYTNDETPVKILSSTGAFANSTISGYVTSGKWSYTTASTLTLYAHWEINTHSLHWYKNDDDADDLTGSYTDGNAIEYGATITAPNTPTFTGRTFEGWSTTSSGSTTDPETSMPDEDLEYYAIWSLNSHKVSVASPANIAIKATPSGESAIEEGGSNASVDYGTSVTLSYTGLSAGYAINRWKVTKDEDESDVTASVVEGNTLTMPDYDVTVDVILYTKAKMKTRCLEFDVEGDVWLTSYAGQEVFTADAPENRITITCDDWGDADRMYVSYYNGAGESVAKASSLFRVCDASTYNKVDASNNYFAISGTDHASGVKYVISYNPGASRYDQEDTWTIRFTAQNGASTVLGHKDLVVHGRVLPEYFAIASKAPNGKWYALPNTIVGNSASITPIEVSVDNTTTPTTVTYAPTTVKYKGGSRYASGTNRYAIGILDPSDNKLKTSKDKTYVYTGSGSANYQDWYLESTDFGAYTMWVPSDDSEVTPKKMGISSGKIGYFASPDSPSEQIYLLPVTNWLTPNEAKVTEWGQKSVILDVDAQSPIVSAQAHFGDRESAEEAASFGQTRTSVANGASKYNYTLTFTTTDFSEHKGELLYIDWLDDESAVQSTSAVSIPWIIAENGKMSEIDSDKDHWKDAEVHVLPGVTLEADGGNFANKVVAINTLEIYPGATVEVTKGDNDRGSLNPSNLILRNGWTRAGNKEYNVARLYISTDNASVTKPSKAYSDWYIDFDQYYPIAVPWTVTTSGMSYLNSSSAVSAGVKMRYYDGASRATNVQAGVGESVNWKEYSRTVEATTYKYPETLTPGIGYAMTARRPTGKAFSIIRMPLTIPSSDWLANGEQGVVSDTHKDQVTVTAHDSGTTPEYAKGWNFVANPYMSLYKGTLSYAADDDIAYANIPDINFKEYDQVPIDATTKLKPSSGFLIQAPKNGTATFAAGSSTLAAAAPSIHRDAKESTTPTQKAYVVLRGANTEDMMGIWIADKYTEAYESNADLQKLLGDGTSLKTYMLYRDMEMAYLAINSVLAQEWIPIIVRIPSCGEYTFSLHKASILGEVERVSLIDYSNGQITNLMTDNYSFTSTSGTISGRFAINTVVGQRETPTDIDIIQGGGDLNSKEPFKFLYRYKVYIYHRGVIYDTTGKKVKVINK